MKKNTSKVIASLVVAGLAGVAGCAQVPQEPPAPSVSPAIDGVQAVAPVDVKNPDDQIMLQQNVDAGHYGDDYSLSWLHQSLSGTSVTIDRVKYSNGFNWVTGVRLRMPVPSLFDRRIMSNETLEYRVGLDLSQMPGYIYIVPGEGVGHYDMDRVAQAFKGSGVADGRMVYGKGIAPKGYVDIYVQDEPAR